MSSKNNVKLFRTVLAVGFLMVLAGLTLLLTLPSSKAEGFLFVFYMVLMFVASVVIYFSIVLQKGILLYVGLNVFVYSLCATFGIAKDSPFTLAKFWPLLLIIFGVTLIPSGYIRFKRMRTIYVVPAAMLVFLGAFFSLFAFDIIKIPFRIFFIYMWPVILLLAGGVLIGYYFYSIHNKEKFIEETDESEIDELDSITGGDDDDNE